MYYLIDLSDQTRMPFESKVALLAFWRFRTVRYGVPDPLNFNNLNVTGKDTYNPLFTDPWMRQYQVVDDEGRSQDIRTWEKEIKLVNAMDHRPEGASDSSSARFRIGPVASGSKMPLRKGRYGAFTRQRMMDRQRAAQQVDYEDDLLGLTPVRDNSRPRLRSGDPWGKDRDYRSRSWKNHTRNTSQWGRHSERAAEMPIRKRTFEELDLEELARELIGA